MSKYLGFSLDECAKFWKSSVKNKLIAPSNHSIVVSESIDVYHKSKQVNPHLERYFQDSIFSYGCPNRLIFIMVQKIENQLIKNHSIYPIRDKFAIGILELNHTMYICCSTPHIYKKILMNLVQLESDSSITIEKILFHDFSQITEPPEKDEIYIFPDFIKINQFRFLNEKYELVLVYNLEYRKNKFSFSSHDEIHHNFVPFKKYDFRVSCIHGSTCCEPVLINWLFRRNKIQRNFTLSKKSFGVFFIKSLPVILFTNSFLVGTSPKESHKFKMFERILIGYFAVLFGNEFVLNYLNTIRKLMVPCPGCLINHVNIKKNKIVSWNKGDCNQICTDYNFF
jgi:hypothetical protein